MRKTRLTREEALSFLITHIVVEKGRAFEMNQATLFTLMNLASEAEGRVNKEEGLIPHEVIEELAAGFADHQGDAASR